MEVWLENYAKLKLRYSLYQTYKGFIDNHIKPITGGIPLPKVERKEMKTIPVEQLNAFLEEAKKSGVFELYYIDLVTGLRGGERISGP